MANLQRLDKGTKAEGASGKLPGVMRFAGTAVCRLQGADGDETGFAGCKSVAGGLSSGTVTGFAKSVRMRAVDTWAQVVPTAMNVVARTNARDIVRILEAAKLALLG